tara:strand:+ start:389 stop:526 length:138 start_codon:yes stop_codon:yes gene_type:complete
MNLERQVQELVNKIKNGDKTVSVKDIILLIRENTNTDDSDNNSGE